MSEIYDKAIAALKGLPADERERFCWEIVERLEEKSQWSRIVATPASQDWLEKNSKANLEIYEKQAKRSIQNPLTASMEGFQREEGYWNSFDELPKNLQTQAEENYHLWQTNPSHPSLRLKQIHTRRPIFSFRVGLQYRTIGVKAPDGKMVWFWIGSVDHYKGMLAIS